MKKILIILIFGFTFFQVLPVQAVSSGPIIFVIDASGSMNQGKLEAVKVAVSQIISNLKPAQKVGIISFNQKVSQVLPPSLDREAASRQINSLIASGDTSMYDALKGALNIRVLDKPSQVILLSDGQDTTSQLKFDQLLGELEKFDIPIEAIGVQVTSGQQEILRSIAEISGGKYYSVTNISELVDTYRKILSQQLVPPVSPAPTQSTLQDQPISFGPIQINQRVYFQALIATITAILVLLVGINLRDRAQNSKRQQARVLSLQKYSYRQVKQARKRIKISIATYSFVPKRIERAIIKSLELIHSEIKYERVIQGLIGAWILVTFFVFLIFNSLFMGILAASAALPLGAKALVKGIRRNQKARFAEELPELLNILASALRSGLSLTQGLEAYSGESKNEVAREIRRCMSEIRVGTPTDEALLSVANRMENEDLRWAVAALSIQRVVGGSMATILSTAYETIRARAEIRQEVRTLAAEGKLSAYVLMGLPLGIFAFFFLTRREYVKVFWTEPLGVVFLIVIIFNLTVGWNWMKKIVEIKI